MENTAAIPTEYSREIRYELDTGIRNFGKVGMNSKQVPRIPVYAAIPGVLQVFTRYGLNTLPNTPVWFGTYSQ